MGDDRFQRVEGSGKTCRQTVWQQTESRVALTAIPASNLRTARGLPRVGAVACQRTSAVRVIRAALKFCIAPRLGPNVFLAGKPRFVAKLHRPRDSEGRNRLYPPRHDSGRGPTALATGASCSSMLSSVAAGSFTGQPAQTGSISVAWSPRGTDSARTKTRWPCAVWHSTVAPARRVSKPTAVNVGCRHKRRASRRPERGIRIPPRDPTI